MVHRPTPQQQKMHRQPDNLRHVNVSDSLLFFYRHFECFKMIEIYSGVLDCLLVKEKLLTVYRSLPFSQPVCRNCI